MQFFCRICRHEGITGLPTLTWRRMEYKVFADSLVVSLRPSVFRVTALIRAQLCGS